MRSRIVRHLRNEHPAAAREVWFVLDAGDGFGHATQTRPCPQRGSTRACRGRELEKLLRTYESKSPCRSTTPDCPRIKAIAVAVTPAWSTIGTSADTENRFATRWLAEPAKSMSAVQGRLLSVQAGVRSLDTRLATRANAEALTAARRESPAEALRLPASMGFDSFLECAGGPICGLVVAFTGTNGATSLVACSRHARRVLMDDRCWDGLCWSRWHASDHADRRQRCGCPSGRMHVHHAVGQVVMDAATLKLL